MTASSRFHATGTGPGSITPDGCPVELYAALGARGEPRIIHDSVPEGSSILELGAGAGRITHELLRLGHDVVAVDESQHMLEHVRGARTVCSSIERLDLDAAFDAVLLTSYLVNVPNDDVRAAFLRTCRRHLADDGHVIIQRCGRAWFTGVQPYERMVGETIYRLVEVERPSPNLLRAVMEYERNGWIWRHAFTHAWVDDDQLVADLANADLLLDLTLTDNGSWIRARRGGGT